MEVLLFYCCLILFIALLFANAYPNLNVCNQICKYVYLYIIHLICTSTTYLL